MYIVSSNRNIDNYNKLLKRYVEYSKRCGVIPLTDESIFANDINKTKEERKVDFELKQMLFKRVDEVWVFGDEITEEMKRDIEIAEKLNKGVIYILEKNVTESLKVRQDNKPLVADDCIKNSDKMDYNNKILVWNVEDFYYTGEESLWIAYEGGEYTGRNNFLSVKNLFNGYTDKIPRNSFYGIVKPDSLKKWLKNNPIKNELAYNVAIHENYGEMER